MKDILIIIIIVITVFFSGIALGRSFVPETKPCATFNIDKACASGGLQCDW